MFVVDTNILLYAAHRGSDEHQRCRTLVEEWRSGSTPWFLTWGICYEFLRETIAELPDIRGNLAHDLHTAVLMREHGISRIYTRDTDFHRFPFLTVHDPLR